MSATSDVLGRVVLRHRRTVLLVWCVVVAVAAGTALGSRHTVTGVASGIPGSPSVETIERAVQAGIPAGTFFPFLIVLRSERFAAFDPEFVQVAEAVSAALGRVPGGGTVRSYWNTGRLDLLGRDRRTALLLFRSNVERLDDAEGLTRAVREAVRRASDRRDITAVVTGTPAMYFDLDRQASADLLRAERVGIPITLLILLAVFGGAPVAAVLPILLALAAVVVSAAALVATRNWIPVNVFSQNVVSMVGLAVGVDYALFAVASVRRRLAEGASAIDAAGAAFETARTIVVSAIAVAIGFGALLLVNIPALRAIAVGGMVVVVTAAALSLTLLPALLSWLGSAVNWPRRPHAGGRRSTRWHHAATWVMERRWLSLAAGTAVMVALAWPALRLQPWSVGVADLSPELEARQGYELLATHFDPGLVGPTVVLLQLPPGGSVWHPAFQTAIVSLSRRLLDDTRISSLSGFPDLMAGGGGRPAVDGPERWRGLAADVVSRDERTALLFVHPADAPESRAAMRLIHDLEQDVRTELNGVRARVGISGTTALTRDFHNEIAGRMRRVVIPVVLGATFLVLMVAFRSVLIPLKAIALNVLSVAASYGFLVLVFQDGYGADLINLTPPGGVNSLVLLVLFAVLFGVSMDYHVFVLSAVREAFAATGDTKAAVVAGVRHTAGPVTGAALVMVCLFLSFGFTRLVATRELGLGLACAVALDATVVRLVLLPSSMAILGTWNWWLPWRRYTPTRAWSGTRRVRQHAVEPRPPRRDAAVDRG